MYLQTKDTPESFVESPLDPVIQERVLELIGDLESERWLFGMNSACIPNVCKTPGCIAGHIAARHPECTFKDRTLLANVEACGEHIGLTIRQEHALFYRIVDAITERDTTRADAIAVLRNYIQTGEIDWGAA